MKKRVVLVSVLGLLVAAVGADALKIRVVLGDLVLNAEGGFAPKALPKHENAPITAWGGGKVSTLSGELPPILKGFVLEFDRHGTVDTQGLPRCTRGKLVATTVAAARRACGDAIVGKGFGSAVVAFPEQRPIKVGSPITLFNGPKKGGNDTVIAHAHLDYPGPTTFIVPVVIERIHKGVFGYRVNVRIPKIAGGYGHPISGRAKVGRKWTFNGRSHSYINARCETGHFRSRGEFAFKDEVQTVIKANFVLLCQVRK